MQRLGDALRNERSGVTLDIAALELAQIEFPGLEIEASLLRLESLAASVASTVSADTTGLDFIQATNALLFDVAQFHGNEDAYYDPRNSCLNSVLARRTGIPITLSVVYMELARRLQRPVAGVGLPGHFIVVYEDAKSRYWIDPFHRGRILSFEDCCHLVKETSGVDLTEHPTLLSPVSKQQILIRMLNNLKEIYLRGRAHNKARQVLDLLIEAMPGLAEEYRNRGLIHMKQLNYQSATADLKRYLQLEPESPDKEEVHRQLVLIERWKAGLN